MSWQPKGGELLRNGKPGLWSLPGSRIMRSGLSRCNDGDRYQHMLSEIDVERIQTQTHGPKLAPAFRDPAVGGLRSSISEEFRKTMLDSHWPRSRKADDASCHYTTVTVPGMTLHMRLDESRCPHLLIGRMRGSGCFSKT
jgi:hypothetical protein